jgi:hypothetical protein
VSASWGAGPLDSREVLGPLLLGAGDGVAQLGVGQRAVQALRPPLTG